MISCWKARAVLPKLDAQRLVETLEALDPAPPAVSSFELGERGLWEVEAFFTTAPDEQQLARAVGVEMRIIPVMDENWVARALDGLPPVEAGKRYVAFMGGAAAVLEKAQISFDEGDYRWTAQVVSHVVFANPANKDARELLARTFEQLGYQAENAVWRNFYLMGAQELRTGVLALPLAAGGAPEVMAAMTPEMILDLASVRLNPERAGDRRLTIGIRFSDAGRDFALRLANAVLIAEPGRPEAAEARVTLPRMALLRLVTRAASLDGTLEVEGARAAFAALIGMLDPPGTWFGMSEP